MNLKRKLSLGLAAALALGCGAFAEPADLQAQLDDANARIAELEAQVEKYKPYYENQIVAEYGEDGIIWLEDAKKQYDEAAAMYAQYGIPVDSYAAEIKQSIVEGMVQEAVLKQKAAELGIGQPDEATLESLKEEAAKDFDNYVNYYTSYFATEGATDEENRQATIDGLKNAGINEETILNDRLENYGSEQLHDYITKDVAVTDEDVEASYKALIETQKEEFADDYNYNSALSGGETVAWNPEGYRAVKHVLIKFSDEQSNQYNEMQETLNSLNEELAALDKIESGDKAEGEAAEAEATPETETAEAETEATEAEAAQETETTAEGETEAEAPEAAPRSREEIQTDIGAIGASIEALYSELMPKAQEVVDAFNAGTAFDDLIAKYGEDPGMITEPTASKGYAVAEGSTYWDPAFTEGAMSIAEKGQISAPVRGQYGIHIIYYLDDITPGEVPLEEIREGVESDARQDKIDNTYDTQVNAWVDEAKPVYHLDRFN